MKKAVKKAQNRVAQTQTSSGLVDLNKLAPDERRRVENVLRPRNTVLSNRHPYSLVEELRNAADEDGETLVEWLEQLYYEALRKRK